MALKTMMVIQRETGRKVTINAKDFNSEKYALESEVIQAARVTPPPAPAPEVTNFEVSEPAEEEQPRRRRGRG